MELTGFGKNEGTPLGQDPTQATAENADVMEASATKVRKPKKVRTLTRERVNEIAAEMAKHAVEGHFTDNLIPVSLVAEHFNITVSLVERIFIQAFSEHGLAGYKLDYGTDGTGKGSDECYIDDRGMGWKVEFSESKRKGREVSFRKITPTSITPASSEVTEPAAEAVTPPVQPASIEETPNQDSVIGRPEDVASVTPILPPVSITPTESDGWPQPQQSVQGLANPFLPHVPAESDNDEHEADISNNAAHEGEGDPYELGD